MDTSTISNRRIASRIALFGAYTLLACGTARAEQAKSADSFMDSIGLCTRWGVQGTPYSTDFEGVKRRLIELRIRHVRDGFTNHILDLGRLGIKTCVVAEPEMGTVEQIRDRIKAINAQIPAIDAVEGPSEPDIQWINRAKSYNGKSATKGPEELVAGVTSFQKDLYTAIKGEPATAGLKVIGPALGRTYDTVSSKNPFDNDSLMDFVDWGNFHPYPNGNPYATAYAYDSIEKYYHQGNMPSVNIDEFPHAFTTYQPPFGQRLMVATETGYSTFKDGASETAQAKYTPRLFCEYFRKGIARTYLNELVDQFMDTNRGNRDANFGLLRNDLSPKPAYNALRGIMRLLDDSDSKPGFRPANLELAIEARPFEEYRRTQFVHHLLLQKSDGEFYLLIWHEIANEDISKSPHRQIAPPDMPATITFKIPVRRAQVYTYDANWNLAPTVVTFENNTLPIKVQDKITVVRIAPLGRG